MNKYFRFTTFVLLCNVFYSSETNNLDILNFNINGFGKIISGCDIKKKVSLIVDNIINYDIILIQENWKHTDLFKDKLDSYQLFSSTDKKNFFSQSSGLLIAINKDIDIVNNEHILYNDCNGIIINGSDCLASKGFVLSRIKYFNRTIDIYNTHLDAGYSNEDYKVRIDQLNDLKKYILKNSANNNVIICGDFNVDYFNAKEIIDFQNDLNLDIVNWDKSYFLEKKIDYIFYRIKFPYKIIDKDIPNILYALSDHPPISMSMTFK